MSDKVRNGSMRPDFFYRIQVIHISLPPLRRRKQDISLLVEHFLQKIDAGDGPARVPGRIMDILTEHDWPGNVRELRNVLQRYVTLGHVEFLSPDSRSAMTESPNDFDLRRAVQDLEKRLIAKALHQAADNRTRAAALLGISRRALFRKLSTR